MAQEPDFHALFSVSITRAMSGKSSLHAESKRNRISVCLAEDGYQRRAGSTMPICYRDGFIVGGSDAGSLVTFGSEGAGI